MRSHEQASLPYHRKQSQTFWTLREKQGTFAVKMWYVMKDYGTHDIYIGFKSVMVILVKSLPVSKC
jgi:hypothetical protein